MLYLSQLTLNPRSRQTQAELRDPYEMHRTLSKAFGESAEAQESARCLFRVEESRLGELRCLVQSKTAPDWDRLTTSPEFLRDTPQVKPFAPSLSVGQTLAFRLRANPTKRQAVKSEGKRLGDRVGLYTEEERLTWLSRKASEHGFSLASVRIHSEPQSQCQAKDNRAKFSAALFEGVLRVTDLSAFVLALEGGIGAGKGFGFGLLSLAPLK